MTTIIAVAGLSEEEFRRAIERKLRHGQAAEAAIQLRELLEPYAGPGGILPGRFLTVTAADLTLTGWEGLSLAVARHDEPYRRITALSIAFGWEGEEVPQPDADGRLRPLIETSYFTDDAFPFSQSARADLLEGYSYHGCTWTGDCEATDNALGLDGIDDLRGALALLEARLLASDMPDEDEIRAGSLGACLLSVLLFQAVDARIARDGLPRRLCVMAGSNGVYPYFDAPVVGIPEDASRDGGVVDVGIPVPRYSSLLMAGVPRGRKRAVLVLDESADEAAIRIAKLRGLPHDEIAPEPVAPVAPEVLPEPSAPPVSDSGIIPIPGGPLMTKKPHGASWDFRDMLSPRDGGSAPGTESSPAPSHDEPVRARPQQLPGEPDAVAPCEPLRPAETADETPVEPGFPLLEPTVQERLQSLIATPAARGLPEAAALAAPSPQHSLAYWPTGPGWADEQAEAASTAAVAEPAVDEPLPPSGLWARLRGWLRWRL